MKNLFLFVMFNIALLTTIGIKGLPYSVTQVGDQENCIEKVVGDQEILARQVLDINRDGSPEQIVIYGNDDVRLLVIVSQPSGTCQTILEDQLTNRGLFTGQQIIAVRQVELVELTNDDQDELYVWLEESGGGGGPRDSNSVHAIYRLGNNGWRRAFFASMCAALSSLEFRAAPEGRKLIYLDEDLRCNPPSSSRTYSVYRWDATASQFERVESGEIAKWTLGPFCQNVIVVVSTTLIGLTIWLIAKRKRTKANAS